MIAYSRHHNTGFAFETQAQAKMQEVSPAAVKWQFAVYVTAYKGSVFTLCFSTAM